nr:DNA primase [Caudoviricetes sp.]
MDYKKEAVKRFGNYYTINKNNPDEWLFPCKLCKKLNDKNLHVNVKTGLYNCFHNCSNHGKLFRKYSLDNVKTNVTDSNTETFNDIEHDIEYLYPFCKLDLTEEQRIALYSRGITDEQIEYYSIYGGKGKRIQIPNKVVGQFTDLVCNWEYKKQLVTKQNPKYLYSSGVKKSNVVFNLHRVPEKANIIVCEGIFNAITASKLGVATYGCNPSINQVKQILRKNPENIIIAYDSDLPGVTGSSKLINLLKAEDFKGGLYYILLPKGVDINDIGHKNFLKYLEEHKVKIMLSSPFANKLPKLIFDNS